jgi:hypothetical protein
MEVYAYVGGKAYHLHFSASPDQFPITSPAITTLLSTLKIGGAGGGGGGGDVTVAGGAGGGVTAGGGTTTTTPPGGGGGTTTTTTTVNNMIPTANAGRDAIAKPGDTVTLDGGASNDPDGDEAKLKYNWRQIGSTASTYPVTLSSADTVNPTFTVPASINGETTLSFQLTVTDERGGSSSPPDTVDITITQSDPPITPPQEPPSDDVVISQLGQGGEEGGEIISGPAENGNTTTTSGGVTQ